MSYRFPIPSNRNERMNTNRVKTFKDDEGLTGYVNGEKASDLEERFARALRLQNIEFSFQVDIQTSVSIPGEDKSVDFLVFRGLTYPVEIDGEIGHKTEAQKAEDAIKETLLNEIFGYQGVQPLMRVAWYDLENQDMADQIVKELFG